MPEPIVIVHATRSCWDVIHEPSNSLMISARYKRQAIQAAKEFAALGDWSRTRLPKELLRRGRKLYRRLCDDFQIELFFTMWSQWISAK